MCGLERRSTPRARDVACRRRAGAAHRAHTRLPSVRRHGEDHASAIVAGPTASRPHARARSRRCGHAPRPTRLGLAGRATWLACALLAPPDAPRTSPSLALLGRRTAPLHRARRRRRAELARAPHHPPPLLEPKPHLSIHPHPLDPPVHTHLPAEPPALRHCGRRGRPPPPSSPTVAGAVSRQANPAN
jgi:hypothetical protein